MDDLYFLGVLRGEGNERRGRRHKNRNVSALIELTDNQFVGMFRVTKEIFSYLLILLQPYIPVSDRRSGLTIEIKILTALRFFAGGAYQLDVGTNNFMNLAQSTVSKCITEVTSALNAPAIFNEWVKFPGNMQELNSVRQRFYEEYQFPGVVGCIDCTHVAIFPPRNYDPDYPEHLYVNRKGYHSINVQLICDSKLRIMNVNAKYPGSTHDSYIWNRSNVQMLLTDLHARGHTDYFLLGDSGYPLRSWLLTPILNNVDLNTPEGRFNRKHKRTRSLIERVNGVLKGRFRCLLKHRVLHYTPAKAGQIINACVVLHNMCINYNVPDVDEPDDQLEGLFDIGNDNAIDLDLAEGRRARERIVRTMLQ